MHLAFPVRVFHVPLSAVYSNTSALQAPAFLLSSVLCEHFVEFWTSFCNYSTTDNSDLFFLVLIPDHILDTSYESVPPHSVLFQTVLSDLSAVYILHTLTLYYINLQISIFYPNYSDCFPNVTSTSLFSYSPFLLCVWTVIFTFSPAL